MVPGVLPMLPLHPAQMSQASQPGQPRPPQQQQQGHPQQPQLYQIHHNHHHHQQQQRVQQIRQVSLKSTWEWSIGEWFVSAFVLITSDHSTVFMVNCQPWFTFASVIKPNLGNLALDDWNVSHYLKKTRWAHLLRHWHFSMIIPNITLSRKQSILIALTRINHNLIKICVVFWS